MPGVAAHASLSERKPAFLPVIAASVFNRSRADRASRSSRVTISTSPASSWSSALRRWARSALAPLAVRWKDYRDDNRQKTMTLDGGEFIRRFLIHVLPDGFHRIRYYGFLGNCHRARKLARCRELIGMAPAGPAAETPADYRDRFEALTGQSLRECPHCHIGTMVMIDCIARPKICQPVPDTP